MLIYCHQLTSDNWWSWQLQSVMADTSSSASQLYFAHELLLHSSHYWVLFSGYSYFCSAAIVQALRLWLKNVKFLDHPRYLNLNYRDEALKRDLELRSSCSFLREQKANNQRSSSTDEKSEISDHLDNKGNENLTRRWCVWRDAQWPWSWRHYKEIPFCVHCNTVRCSPCITSHHHLIWLMRLRTPQVASAW